MKKVAVTVAVLALGLTACAQNETNDMAANDLATENMAENDMNMALNDTTAEDVAQNALDNATESIENASEAVENVAENTTN